MDLDIDDKEINLQSYEKDLLEFLEEEYDNADNKEELDYWSAYSNVILEHLHLRSDFKYSKKDVARKLGIKKSKISNFENISKIPSYDFLAKLSALYGHFLGITLYGDFMMVIPEEKQEFIKKLAKKKNMRLENYLEQLLNDAIMRELENDK